MAIEMFDPKMMGADLFCDGLGEGEFGECVLGENGPAMVSDYAWSGEDARRLVLNTAESAGWTPPSANRYFARFNGSSVKAALSSARLISCSRGPNPWSFNHRATASYCSLARPYSPSGTKGAGRVCGKLRAGRCLSFSACSSSQNCSAEHQSLKAPLPTSWNASANAIFSAAPFISRPRCHRCGPMSNRTGRTMFADALAIAVV